MLRSLLVSAALLSSAVTPAIAQEAANVQTPAPYAPYAFLIGDWETGPPDGAPLYVDSFVWGPNRAYIWQSVSLLRPEGEHLHFEGPMMWNAATQRLDFLFAIEPGTLGQESGEVYAGADGSIVRAVTLTNPEGGRSEFRHTIRQTGADTAEASLLRRTPQGGWAPNFPGSDRLLMRRRASPR